MVFEVTLVLFLFTLFTLVVIDDALNDRERSSKSHTSEAADTDVYKAVKNLKVGDTIDLEGFLYWYNGVNPHITSVKVVK